MVRPGQVGLPAFARECWEADQYKYNTRTTFLREAGPQQMSVEYILPPHRPFFIAGRQTERGINIKLVRFIKEANRNKSSFSTPQQPETVKSWLMVTPWSVVGALGFY